MATEGIVENSRTMTPQRWALLKTLFNQALELKTDQHLDFVREACSGDVELEADLITLLDHRDTAPSMLAGPTLSRERLGEYLEASLRTFNTGEIVSERFRIRRLIAEGGMGEVYAADDRELGEPVALKTILPRFA